MTSGHSHDDRDALADDARPDDRLAQAARSAHAASLDHLSPRVRAQLTQRRRAALAEHGRSPAPRRWPMLALGSAAAVTLTMATTFGGACNLNLSGPDGVSPYKLSVPAGVAFSATPTNFAFLPSGIASLGQSIGVTGIAAPINVVAATGYVY